MTFFSLDGVTRKVLIRNVLAVKVLTISLN